MAFLSGPEAWWQAGLAGASGYMLSLRRTVTQLLFEVWEDSLPRPRREETAVEQAADADVQECTVSAPLGNFSSDALTLVSPAEFADSEA